ncbi:helix-turn-helix transcriptional regulator [Streptomyces sp. CBMA152]|uniref:helix-turn-helix domain-containing protein n=1 Tax=Streptomyces sp. CBMA152 TaxID=1896312 RepID=UPI0016615657|nr:helix-turn-helix transcriptional regulator [Streptomyces sp. CBMA152]MBD0745724.1 transcriptional regulator [Streptomyces sp. CBMA152]
MDREERPESAIEEDGTSELFIAVGEQLKVLRIRAGLTQREFGKLVGYTEGQISALERGVRIPQPDFLDRADQILNAGGVLIAAKRAIEKAQAKARVRHPGWFRDYVNVEAQAVSLHDYSTQAVPGLLQTEDYARAVFTQRRPLLDEGTVEKRVTDRLSRQQIFDRWPAPTFSFVLEQSMLSRPVGGRTVQMNQLQRLLHLGSLRTVELQVMPTDREDHAGLGGPFIVLTPKGRQQVAYTEIYGHPRLITDQDEVRVFADRYGIIRAQALTPRESLSLIEKMLGDS